MSAHVHAASPGLVPLVFMWFAMMAAMMGPTVWPWVRSYHRFGVSGIARESHAAATLIFAGGYLGAWLAYSIVIAFVQQALAASGALDHQTGMAPLAGTVVFVAAGIYQFAPLKRACLAHCRNPFSYFLSRWREGPSGGFRMGLGHGMYCVGCCWALMATALAVGTMNLWWMAVLAGVAFVEQVAPRGDLLRVPLGAALIAAGVWRIAGT